MTDSPPADAAQVERLARTRRLATGVLAALAAVFVATHLVGGDTWGIRLIRSMAEAGMVGGLADWFAVEALFRRPLGLPIPHTALLPANQARAARNVGRFFEAHFLDPVQLDARLRRIEISRHAADWLAEPENALALARQLTALLGAVVRQDPSPRMLVRARAWLRAEAMSSGADAAIARSVAAFVKAGVRSTVVDEMLGLIRRAVDDNRGAAVALVHDRSRWWIAKPVDRRVAGLAVDGVLSLLDELRDDGSGLRRDFQSAVDRVIDGLAEEGALEQPSPRPAGTSSAPAPSTPWRSASPGRCATASPPASTTTPMPSPARWRRSSVTSPPGFAPTRKPAPGSTPASPRSSPGWSAICGRCWAAMSPTSSPAGSPTS